jgi:hypothetical protein
MVNKAVYNPELTDVSATQGSKTTTLRVKKVRIFGNNYLYSNVKRIGDEYNITVVNGKLTGTIAVTITLPYPATLTDTSLLAIYRWVPEDARWEKIGGVVDIMEHTISVDVTEFSTFAVGMETGVPPVEDEITTYNYPNPFDPTCEVTTIKYQVPGSGTCHVSIKIYNIAGELVRTLSKQTVKGTWETIEWDGKNNDMEIVASGVYIYVIKAEGLHKCWKMAVIK